MDLLLEFEGCVWHVMEESDEANFSDEEIAVMIIYTVGVIRTAVLSERHSG